MTAPVAHGYPDYGRTSARANVLYHDVTDADIDAQEALPRKFVGDRAYIQFFFSADTNHFDLSFTYSIGSAGQQTTATQKFSCRQGGSIESSDPVKGPYVSVVVTPSAVNSAYTFKMWGTDGPSHQGSNDDFGNLLYDQDGISIGATTTRTDEISVVWPGPASFFVVSTAASWTSYVEGINKSGTVRHIARRSQVSPVEPQLFFLPRSTVRIRTTNNDAGARLFFMYLNAHPQGLYG